MRISHYLLACLLFTGSSSAFAGNGLGDAIGSLIELLLIAAIVSGLLVGTLCAHFMRRSWWKGGSLLFLVAVIASIKFPFAAMLLAAPVMVFIAISVSIFYLVRGGLFRARIAMPAKMSTDGKPLEPVANNSLNLLRWIAWTYLFCAVVSLVNIELLSFLAFPPAMPLFREYARKFLPFILPPLMFAIVVGAVVTILVVKKSNAKKYVAPLIFNACVLVTFFVSAEVSRHYLMSQSLRNHKPVQFESATFLKSVLSYRHYSRMSHASFVENGKNFRWSYSACQFLAVP